MSMSDNRLIGSTGALQRYPVCAGSTPAPDAVAGLRVLCALLRQPGPSILSRRIAPKTVCGKRHHLRSSHSSSHYANALAIATANRDNWIAAGNDAQLKQDKRI
jgi:hypothetical protein